MPIPRPKKYTKRLTEEMRAMPVETSLWFPQKEGEALALYGYLRRHNRAPVLFRDYQNGVRGWSVGRTK